MNLCQESHDWGIGFTVSRSIFKQTCAQCGKTRNVYMGADKSAGKDALVVVHIADVNGIREIVGMEISDE